jgi:hypothetical protein
MRNPVQLLLGAVLMLFGTVFFLQGIDLLKGSSMTGKPVWVVLGPVIALPGLGLIVRSTRKQPHP